MDRFISMIISVVKAFSPAVRGERGKDARCQFSSGLRPSPACWKSRSDTRRSRATRICRVGARRIWIGRRPAGERSPRGSLVNDLFKHLGNPRAAGGQAGETDETQVDPYECGGTVVFLFDDGGDLLPTSRQHAASQGWWHASGNRTQLSGEGDRRGIGARVPTIPVARHHSAL